MNCSEFENIVVELTRNHSDEATAQARQEALSHQEICGQCAIRYKTEKALFKGLKAVSVKDEALSAPFHIEANLLVAFRTQHEKAEFQTNKIPVAPSRFAWKKMFALAAAFLLLCLIGLSGIRQLTSTEIKNSEVTGVQPTPTASVINNEPTRSPNLESANFNNNDSAPKTISARKNNLVAVSTQSINKRRPNNKSFSGLREDQVTVDVGPFEVQEAPSVKDFMVFDYAQNMVPPDAVQMMRVRMPRARLGQLGIPVPREMKSADYVNADLLVGNDGTPRAIRMVKY